MNPTTREYLLLLGAVLVGTLLHFGIHRVAGNLAKETPVQNVR